MDGWMDEWMDGWMDGRIDGWTDGWMDGIAAEFLVFVWGIYGSPRSPS